MATMPVRRLGVALLAVAVASTTGTAFATNLSLTAPGHVGAYQQANTKPCTFVSALVTIVVPPYPQPAYVDTIRLAGTGCTGTSLTVKVTLNSGATHPETIVMGVAGTAINIINGTGPLIVDVHSLNVASCGLQYPIAVLVTTASGISMWANSPL